MKKNSLLPILSLKDLYKSYKTGTNVLNILNGINLDLYEGEIVALIGPSGSGKSTLLYTAGLLDKYDKGEIIINGTSTYKLNDTTKTKLRLFNIGFIYQQHNLFSDFTALENVALPLMIAGQNKKDAEKIAISKLSELGLSNRLHHKPTELSGGEQQRVAIARSLANNPKLLLADEPTGNLDLYNADSVLNVLLKLVSSYKMTALVATHNPLLASKMDRQLVLIDGKIYDLKNKEDIKFLSSHNIGSKIIKSFK